VWLWLCCWSHFPITWKPLTLTLKDAVPNFPPHQIATGALVIKWFSKFEGGSPKLGESLKLGESSRLYPNLLVEDSFKISPKLRESFRGLFILQERTVTHFCSCSKQTGESFETFPWVGAVQGTVLQSTPFKGSFGITSNCLSSTSTCPVMFIRPLIASLSAPQSWHRISMIILKLTSLMPSTSVNFPSPTLPPRIPNSHSHSRTAHLGSRFVTHWKKAKFS